MSISRSDSAPRTLKLWTNCQSIDSEGQAARCATQIDNFTAQTDPH
ncbi:hypothetical protein RSSM_06773 [Rhodopirellula sallentina SM41]|uniref:Uncharacterized protein n=1 Tax=Rhodopirellula sallentina SM41 TaxID=1263870 RepID=M5U1R9_9BACT|nr:hypothetical protein RSSM_06773 [Rhodopirellula sallentina SM41]